MPCETDHIRQAKRNVEFVRALDPAKTEFPEWAVTGSFYSALHLMDALLAKNPAGPINPSNHGERTELVRLHLFKFLGRYMRLKGESERAPDLRQMSFLAKIGQSTR